MNEIDDKIPSSFESLQIFLFKLLKSIGLLFFIFSCCIITVLLMDGKGERTIISISGFLGFSGLAIIWKPTLRNKFASSKKFVGFRGLW